MRDSLTSPTNMKANCAENIFITNAYNCALNSTWYIERSLVSIVKGIALQEEFDKKYRYMPRPRGDGRRRVRKAIRKCYEPCTSTRSLWRTIVEFMPILGWLPAYSWKSNLMSDIIGGLTVGIMHVPQGCWSTSHWNNLLVAQNFFIFRGIFNENYLAYWSQLPTLQRKWALSRH